MSGFRVLIGMLAVFLRRGRMFFALIMLSVVMMVCGLQVVVRCRLMVRGRVFMMLT
jgi:hypothetical protein